MKLHLRDLFWLILVVALAAAWWVDSRSLHSAHREEREHHAKTAAALTTRMNQLTGENRKLLQSMTAVPMKVE